MKPKIIILQRILPHYREGFFKKLKRIYPSLKVVYGNTFKGEVLKNIDNPDKDLFVKTKNNYFHKEGRIFVSSLYSILKKEKPDVVVSVFNVGNLNIYLLFALRFFMKFKLALWSLGYDHLTGFDPGKKLTHRVRLFLSQKADTVIFYWDYGKKVVEQYSKKNSHYFVAPNTIDTEIHFNLKENFDKTGKEEIKKLLGVNEKFHFVFTGRLVKDKEADILLKAYAIAEKELKDCRLTVIGDGPERSHLESLSSELKIKNVKFLGEILNQEITGKWIYASDAFVMPGRLGNSVVHSFCYGTPVISTDKGEYFHCEGISYLKDGYNGFLAKDGNQEDLSFKMIKIASDKTLSDQFRINAFSTAKNECSIELMIQGFSNAIYYLTHKS